MKRKLLNIILYLILATSWWAEGQGANGQFFRSDRLSSGLITCVCQDSLGFVWVGTQHGLNKFDGYRFTAYLNHRGDSTSLSDNEVVSLYTDSGGTLWVGCSKGLLHYDYTTDRFRRYTFPDQRQPRITAMTQAADGRLLIGTAGYGLYSLQPDSNHIDYEGAYNRMADSHYFAKIFIDRKGCLWKSNHLDQLTRFTVEGGRPKDARQFSSPYGRIVAFVDHSPSDMLVVCMYGILRYNYDSGELTDAGFDLSAVKGTSIRSASQDGLHNLYIGTTGRGLMVIRHGEQAAVSAPLDISLPGLQQCEVSDILADRDHNLWIGCYTKGLLLQTSGHEDFHVWRLAEQDYVGNGNVNSIANDGSGTVWCTVQADGVYGFDHEGHIVAHPTAPAGVRALHRDAQGRYWLGTESVLYRYWPETGQAQAVRQLSGMGVNAILSDRRGWLYVSVFGMGLLMLNPDTDEARWYDMGQTDRKGGHLCNNWIHAMAFDDEGCLWMATASGVSMMKPESGIFNAKGWNLLLENRLCYSLCQVSRGGDMLIGTNEGLYVYHRKTNKVEMLQDADQLQDKLICAMIADEAHSTVWMSTTDGIWEYHHDTGQIVAHVSGNGLAGHEYSICAGMLWHGNVYFGTPQGITTFNPAAVLSSQQQTGDVRLTRITANGHPLNPLQLDYRVGYRENTFTMEFSVLDYQHAGNMAYEWRINKADEWQQTREGENTLTLSELQPGIYDIEVRAVNNGRYSADTLRLRLQVNKPWYKSTLAYLFYALVLASFIGLLLYNFERQRRRDLEESKMRFLINATHDIRSPLTLIMGALGKLKKGTEPEAAIATIDKNAQRLLLLVNQILDERKIDKGQMRLSCQQTDLATFVAAICRLYEYNARQRGISFRFQPAEQPISVWIDRIHFDKVIANLLSNAFKYTPDGGEIIVSLLRVPAPPKTTAAPDGWVAIRVTDSGQGFEDDNTERFFQRFYQGKNSKDIHIDGTGIGLNLSKAITELHGGRISAVNRKDGHTGAILTVSLPTGKDHLKPEEIDGTPTQPRQETAATASCKDTTAERPTLTTVAPAQHLKNYHILVVDDDVEIRNYITMELGRWYRFDHAANGLEALRLLLAERSKTYDLIISDVMMPEMDGLTLLKSIKSNSALSHIPVILLTSKAEVSYRLEGLKKGADAYMAKPFSMEELHIQIDNLVDNMRRLRGKFTGAQEQADSVEQVRVKGNNDALMEKVMKSVNENLSNSDYDIDQLTSDVGISRAQLHRKMKEITGISTSEFIRNLRLEQAARLIREKKLNITQVAYSVGFNNQTHFSTVFKKHFGVTPTEYAAGGDGTAEHS